LADRILPGVERKKDWALNQTAFRQLLAWLDRSSDSEGQSYLEMRRRLVAYFDRKGCISPDELADETLNRVARRLQEEGEISDTPPARYCYIVAKFVFLEYLRQRERSNLPLDDLEEPSGGIGASGRDLADQAPEKEKLLECLDSCLAGLEPGNRELIDRYYRGEQREKIENRRALAQGMRLTMNALSIRACRIRARLEECVNNCCER
jgi:DNA-directed RNA polymerase specialized sigma24 family protein